MKLENVRRQTKSRALLITLAFIASAGLLIGMPLFRSVSAQKGVSGGTGKVTEDKQAARALLEQAIKEGAFELMSSAKQQQLLIKAGMKLEGGTLKPFDYPVALPGAIKNAQEVDKVLSPLTNPLVNNPGADATAQKTQSETTIVLTGATNAISAFNDSGSFLGGVNSFTGYSTTTDMGSTWTDRGIVPLLGDQNFGDPVLARSAATGSVFLATLAGGANGMNIYRSTDGGVTFSSVANGAPTAISDDTDKEWIAVDNFAGTGNGFVYHVYRDFGAPNGIYFTRSTNDGVSFSNPILIASGASGNVQGAFVFVGADHAVYAGFYDSAPTPDRIAIRKSTDQGITFAAATGVSNLVTTGTNGSLNVPAGYRSSAFPQFVASPTNANLLFAIHPDITVAGGNDSNIFFQLSTDGGATWSANQKLNTDPTTRVQTQPAIAIMPDGSALCVTWQDSRNDVANRRVQRFGVIGTISGTTVSFGPNFQVSQPDWTPVFGLDPVVNSVYMGDYDTMAADNSFFYTTFVDCRSGDQDVRFAKIPKAGPGEILAITNVTPSTLPVSTNTCNDLFVTLTNNGTATATGVSLALTTATPGVTIQNTPQSYGDIGVGASVTNVTPFKLSIANTFVCGTTIVINWNASTGESGSFNILTQGLGYTATTMTGQAIVAGTTDIGNHTDDGRTFVSLPFTFSFYGQSFTGANVSSNGNLQFTSNSTGFVNVCPLPATALNNLIAPAWDDWRTDRTGDGIFTSISGLAPNRIFNIEWRAKNFAGATGETEGPVNFEIRLYETSGQIDFVYGVMTANNGSDPADVSTNGASATCGIQKGTGTVPATDVTQFSCNQGVLVTGLKVSFTPLTNCPTGTGPCVTANPAPTVIPEVEPNNTCATAQVLTSAENCFIVSATIAPAGDQDWFRINNVPAGAKAWAYVDTGGTAGPGSNSRDSQLTIFAADCTTQIEFDDDDGTGNGGDATVEEANLASSIAGRTLAAGGTYFFKVNAFSGTDVISPYKLFVVITNVAPTPEVESNNTAATANPLVTAVQPTGVASGTVSPAGDADYYSVQATAGNVLFLSLDNNPTRALDTDLDLALIAPDGATVLLEVDGDSTTFAPFLSEAFDFNISTTGTYFVRVRDIGGTATGAYNLMVSACQGSTAQPCVLTCPANITKSNDPNQCGAVVTYPAPTTTGTCNAPTCAPASGSFFPVGTTTVTCTSTGNSNGTATCMFTVTVVDTQPPTITCPPNQTVVSNQACVAQGSCTPVTFPPPVATDNCPGVTVACVPPSGSCLPTGTTTVTCTATDGSGNTASCSFSVSVFDARIQDDSVPTNVLLFNTTTGQYRFCCNGIVFTGVGKVTRAGCIFTLSTSQDVVQRVQATLNKSTNNGTASLQAPPGTNRCTLTDRNTLDDTAICQ